MIIYLAGVESWHKKMKEWNVKHALSSYYYLRGKGEKVYNSILDGSFENLFLDSGAFTLRQSMAYMTHNETEHDQAARLYLDEYAEFINRYGEGFTLVAELDVGTWQQKTRYREMLEDKIKANVILTPVIHRADPPQYVDYLCKHYPYVAFGALRGYSIKDSISYMGKRLVYTKKYGTKSHGFAMTIVEVMKKFGLTSVDSASWVHGSKHGMTFYFDGRDLRSYDKFNKWIRLRFKNEVKNLGISWDDFMDDKARAVDSWNLAQWVKFQEYLDDEERGLGKFKRVQEAYWRNKDEGEKRDETD